MAFPPLLERAEAPILVWKTVAVRGNPAGTFERSALRTAACLIPAGAMLARGGGTPETQEFCSSRLTFLSAGRWAAEGGAARFVVDPALREVFSVVQPSLEARRYAVGETADDPVGLWSYAEPWQTIWVPAGSVCAHRAVVAAAAPGAPGAPDLVYPEAPRRATGAGAGPAPAAAMADLYLAGYYGACPAGAGSYALSACGGPSRWAVAPRPAPDAPGLLWSVPFAGRRYAFVFDAYEPGEGAPFFARFRRAAPGGELVHAERTVHVYQADALLPGFEPATELWDGLEADELEGTLHCIDLGPLACA